MKRMYLVILLLTLTLNLPILGQINRSGVVRMQKEDGKSEEVALYKASYALVIGVSDYTEGWQDLPGVVEDVEAVSAILKDQGFDVTVLLNPKSSELTAGIEKFIYDYGYDYENRLFIYYAGHGNTQKSGAGYEQGFIVPSDAPLPDTGNGIEFRRKAVSMDSIERYAQEINSKHALFVFDSCFSGALITKTRSSIPPQITFKTTQPVRQFITAGTDNQEVPDVSEFRKQFVLGIKGEADRNKDGFVTASELADFLQDSVSRYTRGSQTPQYGKIRDARLDKGDFVFVLPKKVEKVVIPTPAIKNDTTAANVTKTSSIAEEAAWSLVKDSNKISDLHLYLQEFPNGFYADAARFKIKIIEKNAWDLVKDSGDTDKIQAFLNSFPNSDNAPVARIVLKQLKDNMPVVKVEEEPVVIKAGTVKKNAMGMEFVWIPPGEFMMGATDGDPDEVPVHRVTIKEGFWMGRYEITQEQYLLIMGVNPSKFTDCGKKCPVESMTWKEAKEFINKLNEKKDGFVYSLPTEAEWEYAARAGTTTKFSFGDDKGDLGKYGRTTKISGPKPVGELLPNPWGLYDIHGNVWEWCEDIYQESGYQSLPADGSANLTIGNPQMRTLRGGAWYGFGGSLASSNRDAKLDDYSDSKTGIRVVARLDAQ